MAKTQEELKQLKQEYESLNNKLKELTEDEFKLVTGSGVIEDYNEKIKHYLDGLINPEEAFEKGLLNKK